MKLGYAKNLQAKYFTGENIPIYGIYVHENFMQIGQTRSLSKKKIHTL